MADLIKHNKTKNQSGNALFLILIAVALFAALSYAVTQSTRGEGGSVNKEKAVISSSQLVQYPTAVRAAILRMIIRGVDVEDLEFNAPSDFGSLSNVENAVFHPSGGGVSYTQIPTSFLDPAYLPSVAEWQFSGAFEIENIGTSSTGSFDGNEIVMWAFGITDALCAKINEELNIGSFNSAVSLLALLSADFGDDYADTIGAETIILGDATHSTESVSAVPYGCVPVSDPALLNLYYHVLIER